MKPFQWDIIYCNHSLGSRAGPELTDDEKFYYYRISMAMRIVEMYTTCSKISNLHGSNDTASKHGQCRC